MMASSEHRPSPLEVPELVVKKSPRHSIHIEYAIADREDEPLGITREAGNKALLLLNSFSDHWLFPSRPKEVLDQNGAPVLWIEFSGVLRRVTLTVRRPDRSLLGRIVGQTWATTLRNKGFRLEVEGEQVGQILADKDEYRMIDSSGTEFACATKRRGSPSSSIDRARTTLRVHTRLSEEFAGIAVAAAILRHMV